MLRFMAGVVGLLVLAATAYAQPVTFDASLEDRASELLSTPVVREDLGLNQKQLDAYRALFRSEPPMSIEEQRRLTSARAFRRRTLVAYWRIRPTLSETQRGRLRQLTVRSFQHSALLHPEVIKELQLTPDEVARLEKTFRAHDPARLTPETRLPKPSDKLSSDEIDAYWARFRVASHERFMAFLANQVKCERAMLLQLSPERRASWVKLKGRPLVSREAGAFASLEAATRSEVYRARIGEKWQSAVSPDDRDRQARIWIRSLSAAELARARRLAIQRAGPIACLWQELARVAKLTPDQQEELLRLAMDVRIQSRLGETKIALGPQLSPELREAYARVLGSK
jgi:hypothetical protein